MQDYNCVSVYEWQSDKSLNLTGQNIQYKMNAVLKDAQLAISAPTHNILDVPDEVWLSLNEL